MTFYGNCEVCGRVLTLEVPVFDMRWPTGIRCGLDTPEELRAYDEYVEYTYEEV